MNSDRRHTLELTDNEMIALMALVGIGMNTHLGRETDRHASALRRIPEGAIDSLVAKFMDAGASLLRGEPR